MVTDKSWKNLKEKLKSVTKKTKPMSFEERIVKLNEIQRGWVNYFRMASLSGKLKDLDSWVRNRLRYCIWSLMISGEEAGTETEKPDPFRGRLRSCLRLEPLTRMGGWAVAQSPILLKPLPWNA